MRVRYRVAISRGMAAFLLLLGAAMLMVMAMEQNKAAPTYVVSRRQLQGQEQQMTSTTDSYYNSGSSGTIPQQSYQSQGAPLSTNPQPDYAQQQILQSPTTQSDPLQQQQQFGGDGSSFSYLPSSSSSTSNSGQPAYESSQFAQSQQPLQMGTTALPSSTTTATTSAQTETGQAGHETSPQPYYQDSGSAGGSSQLMQSQQPLTSSTTTSGQAETEQSQELMIPAVVSSSIGNLEGQTQPTAATMPSAEGQTQQAVPIQDPNCPVPDTVARHIANPTFSASYPGSGAKLTWKLIRAITGLFTGDDHDHNGKVAQGLVVAVKTHYPAYGPKEVFDKEELTRIGRSILIMRNPLKALPSFCNFVYEQVNGLRNHSTRAPLEEWIKWRNDHFEEQLLNWINHQKFWVDNYGSSTDANGASNLHVVAMEHMTTTRELGADTLRRLGAFLAQGGSDIYERMVPVDRLSCIWDMFVTGNIKGEKDRRKSHRTGGPSTYPFTEEQLASMVAGLEQLKNEYPNQADFGFILSEYIEIIKSQKDLVGQM